MLLHVLCPELTTVEYTDRALKIIKTHDTSTPLFLYVAFQVTTAAMVGANEWNRMFIRRFKAGHPVDTFAYDVYSATEVSWYVSRRKIRASAEMLSNDKVRTVLINCARSTQTSSVDEAIANITEALKAAGLYDDTLIIWTSDNGAMH